ncbi:hypothetical protein CesoFtcFv8_001229 [Champsocephalus esox]|uniref:Uncharacterized protein n=1 Tax=Champsocephalus esox TaxID=159716 RepID=A0AAN8D5G5_9TELE|nr:hypothetical protein CesoFtcFv8_001229 [Champsocephalus esox]
MHKTAQINSFTGTAVDQSLGLSLEVGAALESRSFDCYFVFLGIHDCFNIDTKNPRIIKGPKQAQFGYTVQQHVAAGGEKWKRTMTHLESTVTN